MINENFEYVKQLLIKKQKEQLKDEDKMKIENLKILFSDADIFFKLDLETALSILYFLGIPQNNLFAFYSKLIDVKSFQEYNNKYIILPDK
ncbi:MAG TPA: hypothetical protein IAC20_00275 [Candidatus Faecisoma merdavium]|nr:hypothetical protein [Candidatus Faecisoma merdavium]